MINRRKSFFLISISFFVITDAFRNPLPIYSTTSFLPSRQSSEKSPPNLPISTNLLLGPLLNLTASISSSILPVTAATNLRLSKIDPSSYSTPENEVIQHIDFEWNIDFDRKTIHGTAKYFFKILADSIRTIFLDVADIKIIKISARTPTRELTLNYSISDYVKSIGSKLTIQLPVPAKRRLKLTIEYETSPNATALQWLTPKQTLGKTQPYMFSQCQSIFARTILPCQDTPAVKFTFRATVRHPKELTALLGAIRVNSTIGRTEYEQTIPIPSYLLAIAVGDLVSRPIGPISKVWAEKEIVDAAAEEFSQTPQILQIAEDLCGPYVWKQYDLLVLPSSFPFGGMENPCLTFVPPTIIAGDKSLIGTIAHEISHSWIGNLVTNINFEHFWLNEGIASFLEQKFIGKLNGNLIRDFLALASIKQLKQTIKYKYRNTPALTKLVVDLSGINPEDAFSSCPYVKGQIFLRCLEDLLGGPESFDAFLLFYINKFKYQSINTDDFKASLYEYYAGSYKKVLDSMDWNLWFYSEGMPPTIPNYDTTLFDLTQKHIQIWIEYSVDEIKTTIFNETLMPLLKNYVLDVINNAKVIVGLSSDWISLLEEAYELKKTKNVKLRFQFMRLCIRAKQFNRMDEILEFVNKNVIFEYLVTIYGALGKWNEVKDIAIANFYNVKDEMMMSHSSAVANILGLTI